MSEPTMHRGELEARCEGCSHWRMNEPREVPHEPATHRQFLGVMISRDEISVELEKWAREAIISRNECGWCRRYPSAVETHKGHSCGEYRAQANALDAGRGGV